MTTYNPLPESSHEKTATEELKGLIQDLSLKEQGVELVHPQKSIAIERIMQLGKKAVEPLVDALDYADSEARGWIIFLLGMLLDSKTLAPISKYLKANEEKIRNGEDDALKKFDQVIRTVIKSSVKRELIPSNKAEF